jgi:DNA replication protein DnaC
MQTIELPLSARAYFPDLTAVTIAPSPVVRRATVDDIANHYGLSRLTDLTTGHMQADQAARYNALIAKIRKWKEETVHNPGLSFLLSSQQVGTGKTHIAKAINASFCSVVGEMEYIGEEPQFSLEYSSKMYTARELIQLLGGDETMGLWDIVPKHIKCLVIDDLGREGYLNYVKADQQLEEKQTRYFHLINHLYETRRNGRFPVSLFITTNLTAQEVQALLGDATWSRLLEMCPLGYIVQLAGIDDYRRVKSGRAS